jgi:hypothetical protein
MSAICLSRRLAGAALIFLACSAAVAQQASPPAPQPGNASETNHTAAPSGSSQLPDAPGPAIAPPQTRTGEAPPPESGFSSSSSPSSPPAPVYWSESHPGVQVTVLENTQLSVITNTPIRTATIRAGEPLEFTLEEDVLVDDLLVIPRGATLHGAVVEVRKAGKLTGSPELILKLVSLDLGGRSYPLYCYEFLVEGMSKTPPTVTKVKTGAAIGTVIGAVLGAAPAESASGTPSVVGTLAGMGAGAGVGAGVGTVVAAVSPGPAIDIPAESQIDFYLASPISVTPVSRSEAARLSEGLYSGGPVLYVRGETP